MASHGHGHGDGDGGHHGHSHGGGDASASLLAHDHSDEHGGCASKRPARGGAGKEGSLSLKARRQLLAAGALCFLFMIGEVVGGYYAGSLAIMTDAAHLLSDLASFLISLYAIYLAEAPPSAKATWGYHRFEVIGALGSVLLIWLLTGVLVYEAILRLLNPQPVDGRIMFATATAGLCVNLGMMKILHQGHGHSHGGGGGGGGDHGHSHGGDASSNLNVQAAFIHVLGDLLQSIGVMIAAAVIWAVPSAHVADPVCTFLFALLVLGTTVGIMRQGIATLLNAVPAHISVPALAAELAALPGVSSVHDLHVWAYGSEGRVALSAHLVVVSAHPAADALRGALAVARSHHIRHSTLQVEHPGSDTEACYEFNEHMDECALDLALEEGGGGGGDPEAVHHHDGDDHHHKGHGHAGGAAHGHSHAGGEHKHAGGAAHGHSHGEHKHEGAAHADA
jgi:zinc transporter 2